MSSRRKCAVDLSQAVDQLLHGMRHQWVRDFLLTPSAIHVNHLLSPALSSTAMQFSLSVRHSNQTLPFEIVGLEMDASLLFVPAFVANQTQYGVGIMYGKAKEDNEPWLPKTFSCRGFGINFRFMISPPGSMLIVCHLPQEDCFLLTISKLHSTTCTKHTAYHVMRDAFRRVSAQEEGPLTAEHVLPILPVVREEVHNHLCVLCGMPWEAQCGCTLIHKKPLHPFDSTYFLSTLRPLVTSSDPADAMALFAYGKTQIPMLGSKTLLESHADPSTLHKLTTWSLSEYLKGARHVPKPLSASTGERTHSVSNKNRCPGSEGPDDSSTFSIGANAPVTHPTQSVTSVVEHSKKAQLRTYYVHNESGTCARNNTSDTSQQHELLREALMHVVPEALSSQKCSEIQIADMNTWKMKRTSIKTLSAAEVFQQNEETEARIHYKQLREEERREKNRAAARRSNLKKQKELNALRTDINKAREKLTQLRRKEADLRKENVELRARIEDAGSTLVMFALPSGDKCE